MLKFYKIIDIKKAFDMTKYNVIDICTQIWWITISLFLYDIIIVENRFQEKWEKWKDSLKDVDGPLV